jgi:hypothetical protein
VLIEPGRDATSDDPPIDDPKVVNLHMPYQSSGGSPASMTTPRSWLRRSTSRRLGS